MQTARRPSLCTKKQQGFTLLELLIASIIFAIMAVMAYGGLANVMDNSQSSQIALKRLQQVQQTISILNRDFLQLVPRAVRDEYGNLQPALTTTNNIDNLVELTRGGRSNPANLLRSTLVRVAYRFEDEKFIRLQWPQLDNAPNMKAKQTTLIDNIEEVTIRFMDQNARWLDQWPPLNSVQTSPVTGNNTGNNTGTGAATGTGTGNNNNGANNGTQLIAIEIILKLKDWGDIRRLYAMN
ncbi:hypothetical protein MNBD_GAMMA06-667 [hydrothermal vent metagenome]|uniref:Type II secretion system protein J n=1 Tax=hydrothermal vent metagenome TaxID=652676 RepID=A0A3B0WQ73_9ZZZZ